MTNRVFANGCSLADQIGSLVGRCIAGATNHGQFVKCFNQGLNELKKDGFVTREEKCAFARCVRGQDLPPDDCNHKPDKGSPPTRLLDDLDPFRIGGYDTFYALGVTVSNALAFVADSEDGLLVFDVSDPADLRQIGACDTPVRPGL